MNISDVPVVAKPVILATPVEVDALAQRLWITFQSGYREFVTRLGEGTLGSFVRVYPPWRIERELSEWRHRIDKYWFWDEGRDLLPKERALECLIIADTINGDELVFHPRRMDRLFILPHDSERIFDVDGDLLAAIEWMCVSGELVDPIDERNFEPFDSRTALEGHDTEETATDPEGESLDDIVDLAASWAKRHAARKEAQKQMRQQIAKAGKAELIYEGILIDGKSESDVGYGIAWRIIDKNNGQLLGIFQWGKGDGHEGSVYEPAKKHLCG